MSIKRLNTEEKATVAALALFSALVMPALAQPTSTWRDTEGNIHTEKQPPLDMENTKGDPKHRPIIAVARVFYVRFNMAGAGKFSVQDEDSATFGPYTIKRFDADHPCQFDLKKGDDKLAEINFNLLTDTVETEPTTGASYSVLVFGKRGSVCWRGPPPDGSGLLTIGSAGMFNGGSDRELPKTHNCASGIQTLVSNPADVFLLQDALAYIFDHHICKPAEMPARAQ